MGFWLFLIFITISVLIYLLLSTRSDSLKYKQSLNKLSYYDPLNEKEENANLYDRIIIPLFNNIVKKFSQFNLSGNNQNYDKLILSAGRPGKLDADKLIAIKAILLFTFFIPSLLIFSTGFMLLFKILFIFVSTIFGYYLPDLWLGNLTNKRQSAMRKVLPDTLDSLVICVEAGLGFDAALSKIVKFSNNELSNEFARVLYEIQVGISRREAFKNLAERTNIEELQSFTQALIQADTFGISTSKILRTQANEIRTKALQIAESKAQKAGVKIIIPTILCIFPSIFVVIIGPALIRMYMQFFKG